MSDLARVHQGATDVVDPISGELVDCSQADLAAVYVENLRQTKAVIDKAIKEASDHLLARMRADGTSKLDLAHVTATRKVTRKYHTDVDELEAELREAGLSEERLGELIVETVERKVAANVVKSLANNNPAYGAIIEKHRRVVSETESVETKPKG
jgi:hypothetical protein